MIEPMSAHFLYVWGSMDGTVDKRSIPTSVTRVRFPYSPSQVGSVRCWFLPFSEGFSGFPLPQKPTHLNFDSIWTSSFYNRSFWLRVLGDHSLRLSTLPLFTMVLFMEKKPRLEGKVV